MMNDEVVRNLRDAYTRLAALEAALKEARAAVESHSSECRVELSGRLYAEPDPDTLAAEIWRSEGSVYDGDDLLVTLRHHELQAFVDWADRVLGVRSQA